MAYSNSTTNYNLPIYSAGDIASWTDTNQSFEDIDAATYTAYQTAASAAQDVSTLDGTVTTLSGTVSGHTSTLSTLTTTTIPAMQNAILGAATANGTSYSNALSELIATDVQDAIDEVVAKFANYQLKTFTREVLGTNVTAGTPLTFAYSDYEEVQLYVRSGGAIFTFNIDTTLTTSRTYTTGGYANSSNTACCYATVSAGNAIAITQYLNGSQAAIDEVWVRYR